MRKSLWVLALTVGLALVGRTASASSIALFTGNGPAVTFTFLNNNGHIATSVTNAQLATPGFLNAFDVFYYTRDDFGFGASLTAAAAAQVSAWATGNAVLLTGDFQDALPGNPVIGALTLNAVAFAALNGHGYVGEFAGAAAAFTSNAGRPGLASFVPLGLFAGSAGVLGQDNGGSNLAIVADAANGGHAVLAGTGLPNNPPLVEFGSVVTGADPTQVIARWGSSTGNPAILARGGAVAAVPEPATLTLLGLGLLGVVRMRMRRK